MASETPPRTDDALLAWSLNFKTRITATPTVFGLTAPLATAYGALHDVYAAALAACEPGIRTQSAVAAKNTAPTNLLNDIKLLTNLVNGTATVTDAQKIELGLNVRATPSPNPPPSTWPVLAVKSVSGWTVKITLKDGEVSNKRGKPPGVFGASVFSFVGEDAPTEISAWHFEGNTGKTFFDVAFPSTVAAGAKVWLTAFWFNGSKQSGPACAPVSTNLQAGSVAMAA